MLKKKNKGITPLFNVLLFLFIIVDMVLVSGLLGVFKGCATAKGATMMMVFMDTSASLGIFMMGLVIIVAVLLLLLTAVVIEEIWNRLVSTIWKLRAITYQEGLTIALVISLLLFKCNL